jgi:hypothetical protein
VPWVVNRNALAAKWGIPPWEVQYVDHQEIKLEFALARIEREVAAEYSKRMNTQNQFGDD